MGDTLGEVDLDDDFLGEDGLPPRLKRSIHAEADGGKMDEVCR